VPLTKAQIGKCGEILVQYRFLRLGIESAPMSTDTGKYRNRLSRLLTRSSSGANDSSKNQPQGEAGGRHRKGGFGLVGATIMSC